MSPREQYLAQKQSPPESLWTQMEYQCRNEEEKHKFECAATVAEVKNELNF